MKKVGKIGRYTILQGKKGFNVEYSVGICFKKPVPLKKALKRINRFLKEDVKYRCVVCGGVEELDCPRCSA